MKLGYEVIICDHDPTTGYSGHGRIMIEVREFPDEERFLPDRALALVTWVTQQKEKDILNRIGQFECRISAKSTAEINESAKALRRIMKVMEDGMPYYQVQPVHVLDALDKIRAVEIVHDWRYPKWVPVEDVLPKRYKCWCDSTPDGYNGYTTVQELEISAKADILSQAAERGQMDWIKEFLDAGMPVEISKNRNTPDSTPARKRLADVGLLGGDDD